MEKNFMITIKYEGRQVYANVFEYKHSPALYHVYLIDNVVKGKITLHEEDGRIIPDPASNINPELMELVIAEIKKNPNRI